MPYVFLILAIASEIVATSLLKGSDGFSKLWPSVGVVAGYAVSFYALSLALKEIPVSTAYAIWSGVGTAVIAVIGFWLFKEPLSLAKIIGISLIVAGVVALNLEGSH
ncbi:multidrug transporter EmrE-like cation transporter [Psychromicrobium silvestre]|uniref:Multidrug transporter EmrE-like cation transporter n=1 Tax=Psychromicrobium silvestre TaxID=1645614 RepID=A0A7Y9LR37_9MICC|nr:multidrug efflux SMR transporter [Psychromicrobium silvestre]NYE94043.1 multidrug transporter EmrE-like cation transporter [Psychromicrobium silvestre]